MVNRWRFVTETLNSTIFVDYRARKTKIVGNKKVYYYDGIYPNIDYNTRRVFSK